jgi:hypothetical protein
MIDFLDQHEGLIAFLAVLATVIIAMWQLNSSRKSQREATAKEIYNQYVKLAFENPLYADPDETIEKYIDVKKDVSKEFTQYKWFVAYMLLACEEILELMPKDKEWKKTIEHQVGYHANYLSRNLHCPESYSRKLGKIIEQTLTRIQVTETLKMKLAD